MNDLKMTFDQWYEKQWNEQNTAPSADEAWDYQQKRIDALQTAIRGILEYIGDDFDDCHTGVMVKSIHEDFNLSELLK